MLTSAEHKYLVDVGSDDPASFDIAISTCLAALRQQSRWSHWELLREYDPRSGEAAAMLGASEQVEACVRLQDGHPFGRLRGSQPKAEHTPNCQLNLHVARIIATLVAREDRIARRHRETVRHALDQRLDPLTGLLRPRDWTTALSLEDKIRQPLGMPSSLLGLTVGSMPSIDCPDGRGAIKVLQRALSNVMPEDALFTSGAEDLIVCLLPGLDHRRASEAFHRAQPALKALGHQARGTLCTPNATQTLTSANMRVIVASRATAASGSEELQVIAAY
jgi:hypothetical protein